MYDVTARQDGSHGNRIQLAVTGYPAADQTAAYPRTARDLRFVPSSAIHGKGRPGALSHLISQLLEANVSILRDDTRYRDLSRTFCDPAWRANHARLPFTVLQELLNLTPNMHILLDRVDRVRGDAYAFMHSLVSLIKGCKGRIKILLVASSNGYDRVGGKISEELQESVEDDLGSERFWSLERNQ